jgi:hypothetical protein
MSLRSKTANEPGPEKNPSAPKSAGSARKSASPSTTLTLCRFAPKPPTSLALKKSFRA